MSMESGIKEPDLSEIFAPRRPQDWVEDYEDKDNGCYSHICYNCKAEFCGHKYRHYTCCKICAQKETERWSKLTPEEQMIEKEEKELAIRGFLSTLDFG